MGAMQDAVVDNIVKQRRLRGKLIEKGFAAFRHMAE